MPDHTAPLPYALERPPSAAALLCGDGGAPRLQGRCLFYPFLRGSLLAVQVSGLPRDGFFAFHVHRGCSCATGGDVSFYQAGGHLGAEEAPHPDHAGDLPVLLSDQGLAWAMVYTGRFTPEQVLGRVLVIHDRPDDYRSQPAGESGAPIACGLIRPAEGLPLPRRLPL